MIWLDLIQSFGGCEHKNKQQSRIGLGARGMQLWRRLFGKGAADNRTVRHDTGAAAALTAVSPGMTAPPARVAAEPASAPLSRVSGRKPGELLGGVYPVVRKLGEGGFGEVFLCRHPEWNIEVAVKVPNDRTIAEAGTLFELQREAEEWTGLGLHPFIAYCYCLHPIGDLPLFVVEYAERGTLRDRIARDKDVLHDLRGNLDLAIQLCHALEHAHSHGLVHRDLKPENILIGQDRTAKLTDFGIAKRGAVGDGAAGNVGLSAQQSGIAGTRGYMAPEQAIAGAAIDGRADLFALGVCLYELFCFCRPYDTTEGPRQEPLRPSELRRDLALPAGLEPLLLRLVQWEPGGRPASAQAVRAELAAIYHAAYSETSRYAELPDLQLTASGHNNRGVSYHFLGKHAEAEAAFKEALAADPLHPETTYNLGLIRWRKAEITDHHLIAQLEQVRSGDHGWRPGYFLGLLHLERRDREAAVALLEESYAIAPERTEIKEALEQACAMLDSEASGYIHSFEGHTSSVPSIAFSPDGRFALSSSVDNSMRPGSKDKTVRLWNVATGACLCHFEGHTDEVTSVAFTPDGSRAISGSKDNTLRLWNVSTGACLRTLEGHTHEVLSIALSPDGRQLLSGSRDMTMRLWELTTGRCLRSFEGHQDIVYSITFSPDGRLALSASNPIKLWDITAGTYVRHFEGGGVSVAFSPDGTLALWGDGYRNNTLCLWQIATGTCVRRFDGHTDYVTAVKFSPDGRFALSSSWDKTVRLWEIATGRCLRSFDGHPDTVNSIAFSPSGRQILSGGYKSLLLWQLGLDWNDRSYLHLAQPESLADLISSAARRAGLLAVAEAATKGGRTREALQALVELEALPGQRRHPQIVEPRRKLTARCRRGVLRSTWPLRLLGGHDKPVKSLAISPDGRLALSGSDDVPFSLWDVVTGTCLRSFKGGMNAWGASVAFSADGKVAWSAARDSGDMLLHTVEIGIEHIDGFSPREVSEISVRRFEEGTVCSIFSAGFSPDGRFVLSGSDENILCLWEVGTGKCVRRFESPVREVHSIVFSPDGRFVLSIGGDFVTSMLMLHGHKFPTVELWDVATGTCLRHFDGHTDFVNSVAFSPDGRRVVSGSSDNTMRLWEVATGTCLRCFEGHDRAVTSIAFSGDGELVLSGSVDGTLRLWHLNSGECLCVLRGDGLHINSIALSPDATLALCAAGQSIQVWHLDWELYEHERPVLPIMQDNVPSAPTALNWGKVSRNEPCPCGSGKRYKHCHGAFT